MQILVTIHRYLGLTLALLLLVIAISGGLLLWIDEYQQWRFPELRQELQDIKIEPEAIGAALSAASWPAGTIALPREGLPVITIYHRNEGQSFHSPHDGSLIAEWLPLQSVYSFLFEVHVHLLAGVAGHLITGFGALFLIVMLVSGFPLWWRRRKVYVLRKWRPKSRKTPELLGSHAAQGAIAGLGMFLILLTGAGMVFHEPTEALLKMLPGSVQDTRLPPAKVERIGEEIDWSAVLASAQSAFPEAAIRMISLPESAEEAISIRLRQPGELHPNGRSQLSIHPSTGEILGQIDATRTGPGPTLYNMIYPLHAGKTGWPGYRLVLFIIALASIYLAVTGLWVYFRRAALRKRNREQLQRARCRSD